MASAAAAACFSATVLLLAVVIFTSGAPSEPLAAVQVTDRAGNGEKSSLLPVDKDIGKDDEMIEAGKRRGEDAGEIASLASTDKENKKAGFKWAKPDKLDAEKDDSDSDSDSDHDHVSDSSSDSDSDSDSDSNSDSDSDSDSDEESNDDDSKHGKKEAAGGKRDGIFMKQ